MLPSQVPDHGIVRSQDSTERSWFKVSRFCYMLMKYSCDRRRARLCMSNPDSGFGDPHKCRKWVARANRSMRQDLAIAFVRKTRVWWVHSC